MNNELDQLLNPSYVNIYYIKKMNIIGGIETFLYELVKKYKNKDLIIFYNYIPDIQLNRLKKYVKCIKYTGQKIKCKRAFFNYHTDIIDNIEAEEYIEIIHADFDYFSWSPNVNLKITKYYGVSQCVCNTFTKLTGKKCELCYNPLSIEKPKKVLTLVSATRLSKEKGKERIIKLANALTNANIPYIWLIFTDDTKVINNPNICYMKPRLDIRDYIASADYVVQLSDTEAYCYTILESLSLGTPVIVTPVPSFYEQGINENNSIVIDFNMNNIPVKDIYNKTFNFTYTPKIDIWNKLLLSGKSTYSKNNKYNYIVTTTDTYQQYHVKDIKLNRIPKAGEQMQISYDRFLELMTNRSFDGKPLIRYEKKILKKENNNE